MDKAQLETFRVRLEEEKARLTARLDRIDSYVQGEAADQYDESSTGADADVASDVFEEERDLADRADVEANLLQINQALERIQRGTYGVSEVSGKPIPLERLEVLPWASRLVEEEPEEDTTQRY